MAGMSWRGVFYSFLCSILFALNVFGAVGTIEGIVTDATTSNPIAGATVTIYRPGGVFEDSTTTNGAGFYSITDDPHNYIMVITATGYQTKTLSVKINSNSTTTYNVSLDGNPGSITGTVTGPGPNDTTLKLYIDSILVATTTTSGGTYTFSDLAPGTYSVLATATGYISQTKGAIVSSGSTTTLDFALTGTPATLNGNVSDGTTGIANAGVLVYLNSVLVGSGVTDGSGNYSIIGLPAGNCSVVVTAIGYATSAKSVSLSLGNTSSLNFVLTKNPGTITGKVTDNLGNPLSSILIELNLNNLPILTTLLPMQMEIIRSRESSPVFILSISVLAVTNQST